MLGWKEFPTIEAARRQYTAWFKFLRPWWLIEYAVQAYHLIGSLPIDLSGNPCVFSEEAGIINYFQCATHPPPSSSETIYMLGGDIRDVQHIFKDGRSIWLVCVSNEDNLRMPQGDCVLNIITTPRLVHKHTNLMDKEGAPWVVSNVRVAHGYAEFSLICKIAWDIYYRRTLMGNLIGPAVKDTSPV